MFKEIKTNKNKNNTNGVFAIGEQKFFYKLLVIDEYKKELQGYNFLKEFYPVSNLIFYKELNTKYGLLVFEYENSVDIKEGMLVELFSNSKTFNQDKSKLVKILNLYKQVFLKSIKKTKENSCHVFFEDRIKSRIEKYYNKQFIEKYTNNDIELNSYSVLIDLDIILKSIKKYFSHDKNRWSVISQCDPNDLNIGVKPILFDYLAGGYNPLMAEFAVFFWYNLAQGSYLSPLYNGSFADHKRIYKKLDKVIMNKNKITHKISVKRKAFIIEYIDKVLVPVVKKTEGYNDWYDDFKNYFAMKILAVFDVSKIKEKDTCLSLGYLQLFYNDLKIDSLERFKKIINDL